MTLSDQKGNYSPKSASGKLEITLALADCGRVTVDS